MTQYSYAQNIDSINFTKETFYFQKSRLAISELPRILTNEDIKLFADNINNDNLDNLINDLNVYKNKNKLNDWVYYQLIRNIAERLSPKHNNYHQYTLVKWVLMNKSGYDARIAIGNNQIIFYIKNKEDISDIPYFNIDNQQYTCLNYHDYGKLFQRSNTYKPVDHYFSEGIGNFSYKINEMPEFTKTSYKEKTLNFEYNNKVYDINIKINDNIQQLFKNYPGVDFESYFNIPLTKETYQSLIPTLKHNLQDMSTEDGVDYLMRFTRYAFLYEDDSDNFGHEKRMSPEMTLLSQYSDCDDRVALFFYLVKEIYNLPMVALLYPTHITMAVQFDKKIGKTIKFEDQYYSICEPTPQDENLKIGEISEKYDNENFKVVYHYSPK